MLVFLGNESAYKDVNVIRINNQFLRTSSGGMTSLMDRDAVGNLTGSGATRDTQKSAMALTFTSVMWA